MKSRIAGVDGCKAGWIAIAEVGRAELTAHCFDDAAALFDWARSEGIEALAVDIPIGLPEKGRRDCDRIAHERLRPIRHYSVFSAPVRDVLAARNHDDACDRSKRVNDKGITIQTWHIMPKIKQVDALITHKDQALIREVHPEVSFAEWNSGQPMRHKKGSREGKGERERLIDEVFGSEQRRRLLEQFPRREVGVDDLYDAFAALWSARRIADGSARSLPDDPPRDGRDLHMAIWY